MSQRLANRQMVYPFFIWAALQAVFTSLLWWAFIVVGEHVGTTEEQIAQGIYRGIYRVFLGPYSFAVQWSTPFFAPRQLLELALFSQICICSALACLMYFRSKTGLIATMILACLWHGFPFLATFAV